MHVQKDGNQGTKHHHIKYFISPHKKKQAAF